MAKCAKNIRNGPCGSMWNGECGVFEQPCVHVQSRARIAEGSIPFVPPRDYSREHIDLLANRADIQQEGDE